MTNATINRRMRKRLLGPVALFVYLALLAIWEIDNIYGAPLEPLGLSTLGVILGAMTGTGIVVRRRWLLYVASRP